MRCHLFACSHLSIIISYCCLCFDVIHVYNFIVQRALAGSLGLSTELTLQQTNNGTVVVNLPDIDVKLQWDCHSLSTAFELPLCRYFYCVLHCVL